MGNKRSRSFRTLQHELTQDKKRPVIHRKRIPSDIGRQIVDAVFEGRCNGAQASRTYSVSEATVHRLVQAERLANPQRVMALSSPAKLPTDEHRVTEKGLSGDRFRSRRALTTAQEREMIEQFYSGSELPTDLARKFGVHKSTVSRILRSAKEDCPSRPIPPRDPEEWQKRVNEGVARAMAAGRHPGSRLRLSDEIKEAIAIEVNKPGETSTSVAGKYGVSSSTVSRIIRERRIRLKPDSPQSLEEIIAELITVQTQS